jgi:hypothetical protein
LVPGEIDPDDYRAYRRHWLMAQRDTLAGFLARLAATTIPQSWAKAGSS